MLCILNVQKVLSNAHSELQYKNDKASWTNCRYLIQSSIINLRTMNNSKHLNSVRVVDDSNSPLTMALILDGNSEKGAHLRSDLN